ncbi:alpha/beta hydrolase family esterase [Gordonia sp. NPDC003424]
MTHRRDDHRRRRNTLGYLWVALLSIVALWLSPMSVVRAHATPACGTSSLDGTGLLGSSGSADPFGSTGSSGSGGASGRSMVRSVDVHGLQRTYRIHLPAGYSGTARVPLILAFHGHDEAAATFERYTGLSDLPAIVVYPNGLRGTDGKTSWQGAPYSSPRADDLAFTRAVLTSVAARECVDPNRVSVVGRSNGGGFVGMLACRMPWPFAAFATVSAAYYSPYATKCAAPQPISLIDFHGTADRVIHYRGGVRFGARYLPVDAWLNRWITRAGCVPTPIAIPANLTATRLDWPLCAATGREVVHYRIDGGTHQWPEAVGLPVAQVIWRFFWLHPRGI